MCSVLNTCAAYGMRQMAANLAVTDHVSVPGSSKRQNFSVRSGKKPGDIISGCIDLAPSTIGA